MAVGAAGQSVGTAIRPQSVATLKTITLRLASTTDRKLPQLAASISDSVWSCRDLLSAPQDSLKANNDVSVLVHRFKTHLSSLLQDRSVNARWAAVVLVKATIEAGGLETLSKSNAWVRNLLAILKKHDPPTTRALVVVALTRILMLTWEHTNLIRELTTPALPTFISTCLNNAVSNRCSARELQSILESFSTLLPRHPTIFRSNETQIRTLLSKIISFDSSNVEISRYFASEHQKVALNVWIQLHYCAPKQTSAEKWEANLTLTIRATHATCDRVFRSVNEQWETVAGMQPSLSPQQILQGECTLQNDEVLGLEAWQGVENGIRRVIVLIGLLRASLHEPTGVVVSNKLGQLIDLISRLLSLRVPKNGHHDSPNPQISKDERAALFAYLPAVHASTLNLLSTILLRYGTAVTAIIQPVLVDIMAVAETEISYPAFRKAAFDLFQQIANLIGPSMTKQDIQDIEPIIRACCESALPAEPAQTAATEVAIQTTKAGLQKFSEPKEIRQAARRLLPVLISKIKPSDMSARARTLMERTAVLGQHKDAMIACVLNPVTTGARAQASLLPILARQFPDCSEIEAILRPRMPVIVTGGTSKHDAEEVDEEEEDDDNPHAEVGIPDDHNLNDVDMDKTAVLGSEVTHTDPTILDKRVAPRENASERPFKRQRASPNAESLLPDSPTTLAGPPAVDTVPQTVHIDTSSTEQEPTVLHPATLPHPQAPAQQTVEDDDDSDFEMPPLTMDPDTDPEDG